MKSRPPQARTVFAKAVAAALREASSPPCLQTVSIAVVRAAVFFVSASTRGTMNLSMVSSTIVAWLLRMGRAAACPVVATAALMTSKA